VGCARDRAPSRGFPKNVPGGRGVGPNWLGLGEGTPPSCLKATIRDRNGVEGREGYKELERSDSKAHRLN
jgi:hypothetical protein